MKDSHLSDIKFSELTLLPELQRGLSEVGFTYCTPIQAETLPVALRGEDVAGQAQTGTGKTAAFLLAAFNQLLSPDEKRDASSKGPRTIIIAPTRELAVQIHRDAETLGKFSGLRYALAYGGTDYDKQRTQIAGGTDVLIGTPGRLIDYLKQGVYNLNDIQVVVLDEADRMFDLGFIKDMRYLLRRMPPPDQRLNMLFSATLSNRVMELAYEHMNDPRTVRVEADRTVADNISETVYYPSNSEKIPLMLGLLEKHDAGRTLVFTNTRHGAEKVGNWLRANGHKAAVLTGDVPQKKRESLLKAFIDGSQDILVATDVAARGLHIPAVSHVFNFDLPQDAEDYVHRIGRTARAGASGDAISFACEDTAFYLMEIEEYISHPIPRGDIAPELLADAQRPSRRDSTSQTRDKRDSRRSSGRTTDAKPESRRRHRSQNEDVQKKPTALQNPDQTETAKVDLKPSSPAGDEQNEPVEASGPTVESKPDEMISARQVSPDASDDSAPERPRSSKWNNPGIDVPAIG